uniref:Sulphur transport domain-containing protein n=1 Tax=Magnetococcus massalia (strain MO-1) TaxID=451514 RepID=A0A1S7LMP5_MAGMO|nr:Conserved membrane protein of unknown function [Candidatus Magnetococcus massalia]
MLQPISSAVAALHQTLREPFKESWSPHMGAIFLVIAVCVLLINGQFWGVFGGLKFLGDHINNLIGLGATLNIPEQLTNPWNHRTFISDIALIGAAMAAAMLAGNFRLTPPPPMEYLNAAFGGLLMGSGAALAGGCTVGGFFSPLVFSSPAGWLMLIGLMAGAALGVRMLLWWMDALPWGRAPKPMLTEGMAAKAFPWLGWVIMALLLYWAAQWIDNSQQDGDLTKKGYIVLAAIGIGLALQRSRLCFSKAVREPFMTGDGTHAKAVMLAVLLVTPLAALVMSRGNMDAYAFIPPRFWIGSLSGGLLFGVGMVFAGGCATSTLWRMAEGNLKMFVTLPFFAWSGSTSLALFSMWGWTELDSDLDYLDGVPTISELGFQVFMPDILGSWGWAILFATSIVTVWYLLIRYNEQTDRFTVF